MRFGMFFDLQLPRPWTESSEYDLVHQALEQAEIGDRVGIAYAWAQEHHFLEEYSHSSAPEVFLAALSQRTRRIRIGHGVTLMPPKYNHPARIAERIAMLDLVSHGRVEWGTGESSSRIELEGFDVPYIEKRAMWEEALREAIRMLSTAPYPGYSGRYFSMPPRNVLPKPRQKPHPPLWLACSNRETLRLAARLGLGALTFAFMDEREARFWVDEYYDVLRRECTPIGAVINANVAVLSGFLLDRDGESARRVGEEGLRFFAFGLSHYYRTGVHRPGETDVWRAFEGAPRTPIAGLGGIGTPAEVAEHFRKLENAGVDQVILLQQSGRYPHARICESLELFGRELLPEFRVRDEQVSARKAERLAPFLERALEARPAQPAQAPVADVEAYPLLWDRAGGRTEDSNQARTIGASALWRMHVTGARKAGHMRGGE
jgi:alkanesulfonate monooxygenase SsuD/methylene tetrahydromethanopterin reductase-like flavin-dependent oxidoreductase (luciferase family)